MSRIPSGNAKAERVIGTLKREYLLDGLFRSEAQAREALSEAVALYNRRRPHLALDYQTPSAVHERSSADEKSSVGDSRSEKTRQPPRKLTNEEPNDKRGELALTP